MKKKVSAIHSLNTYVFLIVHKLRECPQLPFSE
jgi:hypothetical protein